METAEEMLREAEVIRQNLPEALDITIDSHAGGIHLLRNLYRNIILSDLDYALDKKVEQELWNFCFKTPISKLQPVPSPKRKPQKPDGSSTIFNWFIESAQGFYLVLLQEVCSQCDLDLGLCKQNVLLGIFSAPSYAEKPKDESCLYICQHCLIHLGDLARYKNIHEQAEGYYKQAVGVEPSSGHPYNQLALLESARGDRLSTLYYYCRSLALKHPFPPAKTNLEKLLKKQLSQIVTFKSRARLSVDEFLVAFLKFQGQIGLGLELDQACQTVKILVSSLPTLVAAESLSVTQLVQMLAVTAYTADKGPQVGSLQLAVDLISALLNASAASACSLPPEQLHNFKYLAVVKLVLDWFAKKRMALDQVKHSGQVWSTVARLLNELQVDLEAVEDDGKKLLPEDVEIREFSSLCPTGSRSSANTIAKGEEGRIRAWRIIHTGRRLAEHEPPATAFLVMSERVGETPPLFFTCPQSEVMALADQSTEPAPEPERPAPDAAKEIKILARPPQQRNVALAAMLKQNPEVEECQEEPGKQVKFQDQPALAPPLPPMKPSSHVYPRPSLPPRLERLKADRDQQQQPVSHFGLPSFPGLPDISLPPPPVPPPGLGFPLPPPSWSLPGPLASTQPPVPYSLFNSQQQLGNFVSSPHFLSNLPDSNRHGMLGASNSTSLWSGPGPSPLERLLEQQKAMRGASPGKTMNNNP